MKRKFLRSKVLMFVFVVFFTFMMVNPVRAQDIAPPNSNIPPQEDFEGTYVSWDSQQEVISDDWSWTNQAWEFGPYPFFEVYLENGTKVTDLNFVPLGEKFVVVVNVQKSIFVGENTLGRAGLQWWTDLMGENGEMIGNANVRMVYVNRMETEYWNETNSWHIESSIYNFNDPVDKMPIDEPFMPDKMADSFYVFDNESSRVVESDQLWRIEFVGFFNSSNTPMTPFWTNLEITDQTDSWIDFGYSAWQGNNSPNRMIAVGKPGLVYGGFNDVWTIEKLDMNDNPVFSVSKDALWKIRVNVSSLALSNVTVGLDLPWNIKRFVNVTGWYQQVVTELGGWMYNGSSSSYYWNSSMPVTRSEQVFGPHLEERWVNVDHGHEINVTRQYWAPETNEPEFIEEQQWVSDRLYLVYNHLTQSFELKQGYSYWSYDPALQYDREFKVFTDLDPEDPSVQFYNLSIEDSTWSQNSPNQVTVDFVGSFSSQSFSDQDEYYLDVSVFTENQQIWSDWEKTGHNAFQIAVDKPVAISTILDSNGNSIQNSMFQTDVNESFIVQGKVYGASQLYEDLDAVGVSFRSNYGTWAEEESTYSDIEIRLIKNLVTGEIKSVTYNRTSIDRFVYGPHLGWAYVNVTDWHSEYSVDSGSWEWVNSAHLIWNETTLVDWHWEHYRLNQTEYALNPSSDAIWIDTTTSWVDDMDPAFRVPSSFAVLNSAEISMLDGLFAVDLNVTFTSKAKEGNYWWDMIFQNRTYGVDWSQGWGEHSITEWTSESIYFVNGSVTGGQAWFVDRPSSPLFTIYKGEKYQLSEIPYLTIGGVDLPIKVRTQYDQWSQQEWTDYMFRDPYNPSLNMEPRYFELLNGSKIYVEEAYQAIIRSLTLNCDDAYLIEDGLIVGLGNQTGFSTYMSRAEQDWSYSYWDPIYGDVVPYFYQLVNGTRVYRNEPFESSNYNSTTNRWENADLVYNQNVTTLVVDSVGWGVMLDDNLVLLREPGWWQNLPDGSGYYLVMKNGSRLVHQDPWMVSDEERFVEVNGESMLVSWPDMYYEGVFEGETLMLRGGGGWDGYVHNFYYADLGVENGAKFELPYPGALVTSWWDLEGLESEGQKLPTLKSVKIDGVEYVLNFDDQSNTYFILVDGLAEPVSAPSRDVGYYYSKINGENYWTVTQNGWILSYGTFNEKAGQFNSEGSLITTTGFNEYDQSWSDWRRYGYDQENSTMYLDVLGGDIFDVDSEMYLIIWKVEVGNQTYFTTDSYDQMETIVDNATGQMNYVNYIRTIDDQKVYFDWNDNPANWLEEIHVPIPGNNYTRLISYSWQPQQIFDSMFIYNITIPEQAGNLNHTGVYYSDGVEVEVGACFMVYGTSYGPGTRYNYDINWETNMWSEWGAYVPGTNSPWSDDLWVNYFTALDGQRIFSFEGFGWMGNYWSLDKQWDYFNGDSVAGKWTAGVEEGGYCVYLNDTIKVDVTTSYTSGGWPDEYLIMTNGTYMGVGWVDFPMHQYVTIIDGESYYFRNVETYYNVTDSGVIYNLGDPFYFDKMRVFTPSIYLMPEVSRDSNTDVWMNATSAGVLKDSLGYYLLNSSDLSRLDLELVDSWWNFTEAAREQIFADQLNDYYPRYSVTIDGEDFFVLDPSPVVGYWDGDGSIENALYRYPLSVDVVLDGTPYNIELFDESGYWQYDLRVRRLETVTIGEDVFDVQEHNQWKPSYQVLVEGELLDVQLETMSIYKSHTVWGEVYTWMLSDLGISTSREVYDVIVGKPEWGMWGVRSFTTVEDTGAIDLDGDLSTVEDQYFVRRTHQGSNLRNETIDRMWVDALWNPNSDVLGDEIHLGAWMGKLSVSWTSEWSESYVWYHASNMSGVDALEMEQIQLTVNDAESGEPNPGYWDISYMVRNQTWADVLAQAEEENWDWIEDSTNEWEWIWFGTEQDYKVDIISEQIAQRADVDLKYEFAGLTLSDEEGEQTHFFMPDSVGDISFITPGMAFGNVNATGSMVFPLDARVDFGVTYDNVNGTLFPYSEQRSMWEWWDRPIYGADFDAPNFMEKPTDSSVDKLEFMVHFLGQRTSEGVPYNEASMKIDQLVGDWNLDPSVIDGRSQNSSGVMVPLKGKDVLTNRSLNINYYVTASSSVEWNVMDDKGVSIDNDNVTQSETFELTSQISNVNFASVKLGSTYDWGKPTSATDSIRTFNVTSQTTPISNFEDSYNSDSGKSSAGFEISSSMYFLTQGYPQWEGYQIYNDPEVVLQVSKGIALTQEYPVDNPDDSPDTNPIDDPSDPATDPNVPNDPDNPSVPDNPTNPDDPTDPTDPNTTPPPDSGDMSLILVGVGVVAAVAVVTTIMMRTRKSPISLATKSVTKKGAKKKSLKKQN